MSFWCLCVTHLQQRKYSGSFHVTLLPVKSEKQLLNQVIHLSRKFPSFWDKHQLNKAPVMCLVVPFIINWCVSSFFVHGLLLLPHWPDVIIFDGMHRCTSLLINVFTPMHHLDTKEFNEPVYWLSEFFISLYWNEQSPPPQKKNRIYNWWPFD